MKSVESTLKVAKAKQGKKIDILIKAMVDFENKRLFQGKKVCTTINDFIS